MATLVENVNRVFYALMDIENAIIDKGVEPTGKCETYADAIRQIPSGGGSSIKFSSGNYELTKGTALKQLDLGFEPQILILSQRTSNTYVSANARTFIYNKSLSDSQYDSIVSATVSKQAFGSTTVLQIYSISDDGFEHRPHATNTTYWTYFAVGGIDATPMLLSEDGEEE